MALLPSGVSAAGKATARQVGIFGKHRTSFWMNFLDLIIADFHHSRPKQLRFAAEPRSKGE